MARENYKTASQLPADKKQELKQKWEEYQNLPEEEKEKLKKQASRIPAKAVRPGPPANTGTPAATLLLPPDPAKAPPLPPTATTPDGM